MDYLQNALLIFLGYALARLLLTLYRMVQSSTQEMD